MKLRVDLLRAEERRYQGPVSTRFAIRIGAITLGVVSALLLLVALHAFLSVRSELRATRGNWQQIEQRFNEVQALQRASGEQQALLKELDRWSALRAPWSALLPELSQIVPASMQLTRLGIRSEWSFVKAPAPTTSDGKEIPLPPMPTRRVYLSLEGRASGDLADEVVVGFVRTLRESPGYAPLFESVKLQRLVRETVSAPGRTPDRLFMIEGEFLPRKFE